MPEFILAGIVTGCIFAISSTTMTFTFISTGIFNLAFAAQAYFIARLYYYLNSQEGLQPWLAGVLAIAGAGFALGVVLNALVFRHLRRASTLIKLVGTIGLAVSLPAVTELIFGNTQVTAAPGLAPQPVRVFGIFGLTVTLDQAIVVLMALAIGIFATLVFRFTDVGLAVRGVVDSEAMSGVSGINTALVSTCAWGVSGLLAGLAGVLIAPQIGLGATNFTLLLSGAFAAIVVGRFRSVGITLGASLFIGVAIGIFDDLLPTTSSLASAVIASVPLGIMAIFIGLDAILRRGGPLEVHIGGALDSAIRIRTMTIHSRASLVRDQAASENLSAPPQVAGARALAAAVLGARSIAIMFVLLIVALFVVNNFWIGLIASGIVIATAMMSISLITGATGMIWLCQITLVGAGAIAYAQFVSFGVPFLLSLLAAGALTGLLGLVISLLVVRLGNLYMALVTFSAAILAEQLVFALPRFYELGIGQSVARPAMANSDRAFAVLSLVVFGLLGLVAVRLRRSTTGLALSAVRSSQQGSQSLGLSLAGLKMIAGTVGSFIAGIAGALLAIYAGSAQTGSYEALTGWIWFAVAVTIGMDTIGAALVAGLVFSLVPGLFLLYLPQSLSEVPTVLFGAGAILVARNPDGVLAMHRRQMAGIRSRLRELSFVEGLIRRSTPEGSVTFPRGRPAPVPSVNGSIGLVQGAASSGLRLATRSGAGLGVHEERQDVREDPVGDGRVALKAEGISVHFGGLKALSNVTVEAERGQITGLVGPNGAGKSTLFNVLSGFQGSGSGRVWLEGTDISSYSPQERAHLGLHRTFQHPELFWALTPREHVVLAYRAGKEPRRISTDWVLGKGSWGGEAEAQYVHWTLELLGLLAVADRNVAELPLGLGKRVEVARAIAVGPKVLLLDEPCSGLDPQETGQFMEVLREIVERHGVTIVLVEHNLDVVMRVCHFITVLDRGEVIAHGTADEIRADARVRTAYLGG